MVHKGGGGENSLMISMFVNQFFLRVTPTTLERQMKYFWHLQIPGISSTMEQIKYFLEQEPIYVKNKIQKIYQVR